MSRAHFRSWLLMLRWKGSLEEKMDLLVLPIRWPEERLSKEEQLMLELDRQGSDVGKFPHAWISCLGL